MVPLTLSVGYELSSVSSLKNPPVISDSHKLKNPTARRVSIWAGHPFIQSTKFSTVQIGKVSKLRFSQRSREPPLFSEDLVTEMVQKGKGPSLVKRLRKELRNSQRPGFRHAIVQYLSPEQKIARLVELFDEYWEESDKSSNAPGSILAKIRERHYGLVPFGRDAGIEGEVPGVEVGQRFHFRAVLSAVGLHRRTQAGIDWKEIYYKGGRKTIIALSVVVSGGYEDNVDEGETLIYTGEGGHKSGSRKQVEDQKLLRGNEALSESKALKRPVRVIRAYGKRSAEHYYSYDGLYRVTGYETVPGKSKFKVIKFKLVREPGQKPLVWSPANVATGGARRRFASSGKKRERPRPDPEEESLSSSSSESASSGESSGTSDSQETSPNKKTKSAEKARDGYDVEDVDDFTVESMDGNDEYEVESIVDKRTVGRGTRKQIEYRVHWRGYSADEDTWEPESNLMNCPEKLAQFRRDSE